VSNNFTAIDLSKLPPPQVVEEISTEIIFEEMLSSLQLLDPEFNALLESDPAYQLLLVCAYREANLRQQMNDKLKATMLAFATGADLDQRAASLAVPVVRLDGESDDAFRARAALAPEGYSTAGPIGAYKFHALSAHGDIKDVTAWNPDIGGRVNVAVLSKHGNGSCYGARVDHLAGYEDGALSIVVTDVLAALSIGHELEFEGGAVFTLDADFAAGSTELTGELIGNLIHGERAGILPFVQDALNDDSVRPLCDTVEVLSAQIVEYAVQAELILFYGPDMASVLAASKAAVSKYAADHHACGHDITLSGLQAALHVEGVQEVVLASPLDRMELTSGQAPYCTSIEVSIGGRDV
jgi:phage-related baseplate assembly protein